MVGDPYGALTYKTNELEELFCIAKEDALLLKRFTSGHFEYLDPF